MGPFILTPLHTRNFNTFVSCKCELIPSLWRDRTVIKPMHHEDIRRSKYKAPTFLNLHHEMGVSFMPRPLYSVGTNLCTHLMWECVGYRTSMDALAKENVFLTVFKSSSVASWADTHNCFPSSNYFRICWPSPEFTLVFLPNKQLLTPGSEMSTHLIQTPGLYPKENTLDYILFCTMTNKRTIISQIITLLHVSTLSCHPHGACNQ
jgi:hypothetical protein